MEERPDFTRDVLSAIVGGGRGGATLADILGEVDARQKVVLSLSEVNAALVKLAQEGLIVRCSDGRFAAPASTDAVRSEVEPVSDAEYEQSLASYHHWFIDALRELDDQYLDPGAPVWPKLSGEWRFADGHYASDLEVEGLSAVVGRLVAVLHEHGFEAQPGPFSSGPGHLEFSVSGRKSDDAVVMLRVARPSFEAAAPLGSKLMVDEWDPTSVGPSMAEVADQLARDLSSS